MEEKEILNSLPMTVNSMNITLNIKEWSKNRVRKVDVNKRASANNWSVPGAKERFFKCVESLVPLGRSRG